MKRECDLRIGSTLPSQSSVDTNLSVTLQLIQPLPETQKADLKNPADHSWPDFQRGANKSTASIFFIQYKDR